MTRKTDTTSFILASASPRRRQLLGDAGLVFDVIVPPVDEPLEAFGDLPPAAEAQALAYFKAAAVAEAHPDRFVLGADTIVYVNGRILGKPADADEARRMLAALSGTRQAVITGVAAVGPGDQRRMASQTTYVTMRQIRPSELEAYVASGEWKDKAGAYAIQETADRFVTRLEGDFDNVVGLPVALARHLLEQIGWHE